jgi:hypothetical protein
MVGAVLLLSATGAASVAALDTTGNSVALNGSDTLHDVAVDVLNSCPTALLTDGTSYEGGGSGVGVAQMAANLQQVSPMSRALASGELCSQASVAAVYTAPCNAPCAGHTDMTSCNADSRCFWASGKGCSSTQTTCNSVVLTPRECGWNGSSCVACSTFTTQSSCLASQVQGATVCAWNGTSCAIDANLSSHLAASLLIGLDGVSVLANTTNACTTSSQNGFGASSMSVTSDGTASGVPVTNCAGCDGGTATYRFGDAFDALKLLYFGLHHDGPTTPTYDCASPARRTLIRQWRYVFSTDCPAGDAACPNGITHAWRPGDLTGTAEALISILAGGDLPNKGSASVGIGTPPKTTPATLKMNPFCNSADATSALSPPPTSNAGASDYVDDDPLRTNCASNTGTGASAVGDDVCEGFRTPTSTLKFRGDLGIVLPVVLPDTTSTRADEVYNSIAGTHACTGSCTPVSVIKSNQSTGIPCPDGTANIGGQCLMPFTPTSNGNDPRCYATNTNKCADTSGSPDGRMYNLPVVVPTTDVPQAQRGGNPFQFAVDTFLKPVRGAFYRIHETHKAIASAGTCLEDDATSQIGCLVDSDPCSVGFAGREAAATFPGGSAVVNKALLIKGVSPFASGADPDANIEALYTGSGTLYPLSRRLYVSTYYGFSQLKGGESALASCFMNDTLTSSVIATHNFVRIPAAGAKPAGVQCLDYDETAPATTSPPVPNTPGSGAQALPGCGFSTNLDACAGVAITH